MAKPTAPTGVVVTSGDNQLSITFTPVTASPAVSGYDYAVDGGKVRVKFAAPPVVVKGLGNGIEYAIGIRALNSEGASPATVAHGTPADTNAANDNGWDDASWAANPGMVPHLDFNDPDD